VEGARAEVEGAEKKAHGLRVAPAQGADARGCVRCGRCRCPIAQILRKCLAPQAPQGMPLPWEPVEQKCLRLRRWRLYPVGLRVFGRPLLGRVAGAELGEALGGGAGEGAEGAQAGEEGAEVGEGEGAGAGEGVFAGDEEVAEVIERLTRIVHNEEEVHSVAQYTVQKLAAAAQQLEALQRREEELVHVWHTTQERVERLARQLTSARGRREPTTWRSSPGRTTGLTPEVSTPCGPIDQ